jgi:hypothetical protein
MISKNRIVVILTFLLAASLAVSPALSDKKVKVYKSQTTYSFVNSETEPVFGLKVVLSGAGEVKTDEETGQAGPFRDIRGNGSSTLELKNPTAPVEPGGDAFDLVFGTYKNKIKIVSWWWLHAKGKKVGKKHKG